MKKALLLILFCQGFLFSQTVKGTISGRIRSRDGSPAVGVRVAVVPLSEPAASGPVSEISSLAQTDASGNFLLDNLQPGRYRVFAGMVDFPTYYPGVTEAAGATVVTVASGAQVTGIDFSLVRPATIKVSGRVTVPAGNTPGPALGRVTLLPRNPTIPRTLPRDTPTRSDGTFEILNVLPGTYSVSAFWPNATLKEPVLVTVGTSDVTDIQLVLLSTETPTDLKGLEQAWSLPGAWGGVASNETAGMIFANTRATRLEIDSAGQTLRETPLAAYPFLREAQFAGGPALLGFGTWSPAVNAYDDTGKLLWSYPPSSATGQSNGIDDAWAADLDGDRFDEVIVGFNGGTGVHVLNGKGDVVWKSTAIGNVWHVAAGDLRGNGKPQVVTTSAAGQIHVFTDDGSDRRNINPGFYANMVRVGRLSEKDQTATIFAAGNSNTDANSLRFAAFSSDGTQKWSADLISTGRPSAYSTSLASGRPWVAVGLQSGQVFVLDASNGAVIGSADGQTSAPELTWVAGKDSSAPLLIVSSRTGLRAYRVKQ